MSSTDWRELCEELASWIERSTRHYIRDPEVLIRARTALAQPEPEVVGPTDQELADAFAEGCRDGSKAGEPPFLGGARAVLARYAHQPAPAAETDAILALAVIIREVDGNHSLGAAALAEAILSHRDSRWGQQPAPPAEGEVGELVEYLRNEADYQGISVKRPSTAEKLTRIADLLERQAAPVLEPALARINDILNDSGRILQTDELEALELARQALEQRHPAPVPVAVSERLPEAGDCLGRPTEDSDAGWCWTYSGALEVWRFQSVVFPRPYPEPPRVTLSPSVTHWLPHHALPLPAGEVE